MDEICISGSSIYCHKRCFSSKIARKYNYIDYIVSCKYPSIFRNYGICNIYKKED